MGFVKADKQPKLTTPSRGSSSQSPSTQKYLVNAEDCEKLTITLVRVFKNQALGMKKREETLSFKVAAIVFHSEQDVTIDHIDMLYWCFQREIGSTHMSMFIK